MDMLQAPNADQADKVLRLSHAGISNPDLAARYGTDEKKIEAVLKGAEALRTDRRRQRAEKLQGRI